MTPRKGKSMTVKQTHTLRIGGLATFRFKVCKRIEVQDDGTLSEESWIEEVVDDQVEAAGIGGDSTALRTALHPANRKN